MIVEKRDGRQVPYDGNLIKLAISKAFWDKDWDEEKPYPPYAGAIADKITLSNQNYSVEQIQNLVEKELMSYDPDVAKSYILYRNERSRVRNLKSKIIKTVNRRLNAVNVQNSNANVDERSFSGREKEASADIQKIIALEGDDVFSPEVSRAHQEMLLYQHDLEKAPIGQHNCLNIDFQKIFTEGFTTRNGAIRVPSTFATACQLVAVAFQCQSQVQFGGVGTVHADYDLAPFVRASFKKHIQNYLEDVSGLSKEEAQKLMIDIEKKYGEIAIGNKNLYATPEDLQIYNYAIKQLDRELRQSAEALYHNLNSLESRAGSQVPFTSINFGRDTSTEGREVCKSMLNASLSGIGKHHVTPIFPISIFQYKKGCNANEGDPNYDIKQLALTSLSKRIYPNFCNCDWSQAHENENDPDTYFSTMGKCKLQPM